MPSSRADKERVSAYVEPDVKSTIKEAAQREGRSVSSYVGHVLRSLARHEQGNQQSSNTRRKAAA